MESARPPYSPADVVRVLTALGDQVQDRPELADRLPEDLVRSARRFVDLTGIDALPDEPVAVVATNDLTTAKLVEHLVRPGEVVNAGKLRGRLARAGRIVDTGYINTTLHRAWSRGSLDRVSHGHYSRVIRREDHRETVTESHAMCRGIT